MGTRKASGEDIHCKRESREIANTTHFDLSERQEIIHRMQWRTTARLILTAHGKVWSSVGHIPT